MHSAGISVKSAKISENDFDVNCFEVPEKSSGVTLVEKNISQPFHHCIAIILIALYSSCK
jgi:hypothetical protein